MKKPVELNEEDTKQVVGGATAVEYGLIAAQIAVVIITAVNKVGTNLGATFNKVSTALGTTPGSKPPGS